MTTRHLPSVKWYSACIEEAFNVQSWWHIDFNHHLLATQNLCLFSLSKESNWREHNRMHQKRTKRQAVVFWGFFFILFGWDFLGPHNCTISLGINEVFYFWFWWRLTDLPAEAPVWPWTSCQQPSNVQWTDTWEGGEQVKFKCGLKHYKKCSQYIFLPELRMMLLQQIGIGILSEFEIKVKHSSDFKLWMLEHTLTQLPPFKNVFCFSLEICQLWHIT